MNIETRLTKLENTLMPDFAQMTTAEIKAWQILHCDSEELARIKAMTDEELRAIVES